MQLATNISVAYLVHCVLTFETESTKNWKFAQSLYSKNNILRLLWKPIEKPLTKTESGDNI